MRAERIPPKAQRSHEALLTMARKLHAAAEDRDSGRFQRESQRFLDELGAHLAGEAHDLSSIPEASRCELAEGQHGLMQLAQALACGDPDSLEGPAARLVAMMHWQRDQERRARALLPDRDSVGMFEEAP